MVGPGITWLPKTNCATGWDMARVEKSCRRGRGRRESSELSIGRLEGSGLEGPWLLPARNQETSA